MTAKTMSSVILMKLNHRSPLLARINTDVHSFHAAMRLIPAQLRLCTCGDAPVAVDVRLRTRAAGHTAQDARLRPSRREPRQRAGQNARGDPRQLTPAKNVSCQMWQHTTVSARLMPTASAHTCQLTPAAYTGSTRRPANTRCLHRPCTKAADGGRPRQLRTPTA